MLYGLHPQNNVLQNGKIVHQLEMLVNHADSQGVGVQRPFDLYFLSLHPDHALLRLVKAEQNAHQGGFACAVFSQQRVYLPFF